MSGKQLAGRIDVDVSRVAEMEKAETQGNITLKSLRRAAEAMECELVYALVPKTTLEDTLRVQAEKKAKQHMQIVAHTMRLEDQGLSQESDAKQVVKMVNEWLNDPPRWLWDSK